MQYVFPQPSKLYMYPLAKIAVQLPPRYIINYHHHRQIIPPLVKVLIWCSFFSKGLEGEEAEDRTNGHNRPRLDAAEPALGPIERGGLVGREDGGHAGGIVRAVDIGNGVVGDLERVVALDLHLGDGDGELVCGLPDVSPQTKRGEGRETGLRTTVGGIVGILPVDHTARPLDGTLRHGRDTSWPDGELNPCGSRRVLVHAVLECVGLVDAAHFLAVNEETEHLGLPVDGIVVVV